MVAPLRVAVVTRIFPNRVEPLACAFARQQIAALARLCDVRVLAVVPYLPGAALFGDRTRPGRLRRVPREDLIDGIPVAHPRAPYLPGAGPLLVAANAPLYAAGLLPFLPSLRDRVDIVLGAYLYPDACAAAVLARALGVPYAVKAHGTDVNVAARWPGVRPLLRPTLRAASASIAVSRPMLDRMIELGADRDRALVVRNGVDRDLFRPGDRAAARRELGLPEDARIVTFVGRLEKEKGIRELVAAFDALRAKALDVHLVFVGDGTLRGELDAHPARADGRLHLTGGLPLPDVAKHLAACDLLALPSWAEGTPNVVLEAFAAGRPVVATAVGGLPDIVDDRTGLLVPLQDPPALADALERALAMRWNETTLVAAAPPSWQTSAEQLFSVLERAARPRRAPQSATA